MSSDPDRSQAARDAGGRPQDDPSVTDTRGIHAVGGVGSAETYGLSGTGEADHSKPPFSQQPVEHHSAGAASFQGQKKCGCEQAGVCTCKGTCTCQSCTGKHTEAQLAGKPGQPEHPRPAVTGI